MPRRRGSCFGGHWMHPHSSQASHWNHSPQSRFSIILMLCNSYKNIRNIGRPVFTPPHANKVLFFLCCYISSEPFTIIALCEPPKTRVVSQLCPGSNDVASQSLQTSLCSKVTCSKITVAATQSNDTTQSKFQKRVWSADGDLCSDGRTKNMVQLGTVRHSGCKKVKGHSEKNKWLC